MTLIKAKSKKHFNSMMDFEFGISVYNMDELDYICDSEEIYVLYDGQIWATDCLYMGDLEDRMAANGYTE